MIDYFLSILMILSATLFLFLMVLFILAPKYAEKTFTSYYSETGAIYNGFKLFRAKYYEKIKCSMQSHKILSLYRRIIYSYGFFNQVWCQSTIAV